MHLHPIFHLSLLEPYIGSSIPDRVVLPPPPVQLNVDGRVRSHALGLVELIIKGPKEPKFQIGDRVWLLRRNVKTTKPCANLDYQRLGPFIISNKIN